MYSMLQHINTFLSPLEIGIKRYKKYIWYFFLGLSITSLGLIFIPSMVKDTGSQAMNILLFLLFLPIFARVFGLKLAQSLMPLRKEIGVFMGTLAFVHGAAYIYSYPSFILETDFWYQDGMITYLAVGVVALMLTIPLLVTSNNWSIRLLWKNWKLLHRLAYGVLVLTVIHVVLLESSRWDMEIGQILLLVLYFFGKILEWKGIAFFKKQTFIKWQLWLCVPCGFIYDPLIGDPDSGIAPGTEFADIPHNWKCPVCWVTKADFVPYTGWNAGESYPATVENVTYLNPTTLELVLRVDASWQYRPGQFMRFHWEDARGVFIRMYSIARQEWNTYTFLIKLTELGRGANILMNLQTGSHIRVGGLNGIFVLQDTAVPKIFIATGTWLAPIYAMISSLESTIHKTLYFSVATGEELFYINELKSIPNLDLHIHVTRENLDGFEKWRIDISTIEAPIDAEWYLCGNPKMITDAHEILRKKGFDKVYSEGFN